MQEFTDRIAVVTGAAGGIGLGLTRKCLDQGMHVVMADIDETRLAEVARQLRQNSSQDSSLVTVVPTDVSDRASISRLVDVVEGLESEVALVFNNAGVASSGDLGQLWNATHDDWQKLIDVNLWGVINGCMGFLPILMQQSSPSRIVNVASIAGVIIGPRFTLGCGRRHLISSSFVFGGRRGRRGRRILLRGRLSIGLGGRCRCRRRVCVRHGTALNAPVYFWKTAVMAMVSAIALECFFYKTTTHRPWSASS